MNRWHKCACVFVLTASLSGCSTEANKSFAEFVGSLYGAGCAAARELVPVSQIVPPVLSVVRDDPNRFSLEDHPLKDVDVGTVIDDLSGLEGCWGRYVLRPIEITETGEVFELELAEVFIFDLAAGRVTRHSSLTRPPLEFSLDLPGGTTFGEGFIGETPGFLTVVSHVEIIDDKLIATDGIRSEVAAIEADGRMVFDCQLAVVGSINETTSLTWVVTLQGDFLKMHDDLGGPEDALAHAEDQDEFAELWIRFDCAEQ